MTSELRDQLFSGGFLIGSVVPPHLHGRVSPLPKQALLPWGAQSTLPTRFTRILRAIVSVGTPVCNLSTLIPERGSWRPPPRSHAGAHTIKRAVSAF